MECIDMMQTFSGFDGVMWFCLGNAYKYLWRYKLKSNPEEDLQKAAWYAKRAYVMSEDDLETWGYIFDKAAEIIRLVELETLKFQAKKSLDDSSLYPDCLMDHLYNFEKKIKEGLYGGLYGKQTKEDKESKNDEKIEPAPWWNSEFEEDDWMFIRADAKIIENRIDCVNGSGYINPADLRTLQQALKRIIVRAERHRGSDS